ncbi:MAG TPA: NADH-quinone oxidoreductase subunit J [Myxococcota bacterium]
MSTTGEAFFAVCVTLALLGALAVVAFETPTRSAAGLMTSFAGVAGACGVVGTPLVPGFILWVGGGGIGLLLLASVLLLNLNEEERGRRRIRLRAGLALPVLGVVWAVLAAPLVDALPDTPAPAMAPAAVATAVVDDLALPFTIGLIALATGLVVGIAVVRRRT